MTTCDRSVAARATKERPARQRARERAETLLHERRAARARPGRASPLATLSPQHGLIVHDMDDPVNTCPRAVLCGDALGIITSGDVSLVCDQIKRCGLFFDF
ncbi:hypothetical protein [Sorangium sp. So ce1335]|uniref:hypothetical protein n=1 Tax=Sorangium sp. So ce1335 TaxID=3133335 RepID=UPI003F62AEFA